MVAPLQLRDPALQRAYVALAGNRKIESKDVDKLLSAARADDGKIDALEKKDLQSILAHNGDLFDATSRARLSSGLTDGPLAGLDLTAKAAPPPAPVKRDPPPRLERPRLDRPTMPADATGVASRVHLADPRNPGQRHFEPRRETIGPADPRTLTPEYREAMETRMRAQASIDQQCNLDPFAARVNGMWQSPTGEWTRVGPSPLEVASEAAFVGTLPGRIYSVASTGKAVYTAIDEPTAGNIGTAALKVGLTGGGEWAKAVHSPIKPAITLGKGYYYANGHLVPHGGGGE